MRADENLSPVRFDINWSQGVQAVDPLKLLTKKNKRGTQICA